MGHSIGLNKIRLNETIKGWQYWQGEVFLQFASSILLLRGIPVNVSGIYSNFWHRRIAANAVGYYNLKGNNHLAVQHCGLASLHSEESRLISLAYQ